MVSLWLVLLPGGPGAESQLRPRCLFQGLVFKGVDM